MDSLSSVINNSENKENTVRNQQKHLTQQSQGSSNGDVELFWIRQRSIYNGSAHPSSPQLLNRATKQTELEAQEALKDKRGKALFGAVLQNDTNRALQILGTGQISNNIRTQAIRESIKNKNLEITKALLERGILSDDILLLALKFGIENHDEGIIITALTGRSLPAAKFASVVQFAVKTTFPGVLETLLSLGTISEEDLGDAVNQASSLGDVEIIKVLLKNKTISDSKRGASVRVATQKGHSEIVSFLLSTGSIPYAWYSQAIKSAINIGAFDIALTIIYKCPEHFRRGLAPLIKYVRSLTSEINLRSLQLHMFLATLVTMLI